MDTKMNKCGIEKNYFCNGADGCDFVEHCYRDELETALMIPPCKHYDLGMCLSHDARAMADMEDAKVSGRKLNAAMHALLDAYGGDYDAAHDAFERSEKEVCGG